MPQQRSSTSAAGLSPAGAFILRAVRAWVGSVCREPETDTWHEARASWARCFHEIGGDGAARSLDHAMGCLARHATRSLRMGCPCCGRISADERRLLGVVAACQHEKPVLARTLLSDWLDGSRSAFTLHHLTDFARAIGSDGCRLEPLESGDRRRITLQGLVEGSEIAVGLRPGSIRAPGIRH